MKLAIVVDDLIQRGGQERLVTAVSEIWPEASIYTSVISDYWKDFYSKRNVKVISSFMQNLPFAEKLNRYYSPFLFHLLAFDRFNFSDFDVVISISSRYSHFVTTKPSTLHICYMNSPGRMFWESADYFEKENFDKIPVVGKIAGIFLNYSLSYLRGADFVAAQKINYIISNSINAQKKIKKYYHRDSYVIYPFYDDAILSKVSQKNTRDYFTVIGRLASWKRFDLAVKACTDLNLKLKVIGEGPDLTYLKSIAGPTVEFLGHADDNVKIEVLKNAKAFIHPQREDFGIVPLEAMGLGVPVIAYSKGGALETVVDGITGLYFDEQTVESLKSALRAFNEQKFSEIDCVKQALKFKKTIFKDRLHSFVNQAYL